jgi:hypothetical protein
MTGIEAWHEYVAARFDAVTRTHGAIPGEMVAELSRRLSNVEDEPRRLHARQSPGGATRLTRMLAGRQR